MKRFLDSLGSCLIVSPVQILTLETYQLSQESFLERYGRYLDWIGSDPGFPSSKVRNDCTLMISSGPDSFYSVPVAGGFFLKPGLPVVSVRTYHCFISSLDGSLRSMAMNVDSFTFGLEFSYPQIYEDPRTGEFRKTLLDSDSPNTALYKKMTSALRRQTKPLLIEINGNKVAAPFRVGIDSSDWRASNLRFADTLTRMNR